MACSSSRRDALVPACPRALEEAVCGVGRVMVLLRSLGADHFDEDEQQPAGTLRLPRTESFLTIHVPRGYSSSGTAQIVLKFFPGVFSSEH